MLARIKTILTYYDSEPTEIMHGIIWFLVYPVLYYAEYGLNLWLIIPSVLLGFAAIKAVCYHDIATRKAISLGIFLFSTIAITMYFIKGALPTDPSHWGWLVISFCAFANLRRITNCYYRKLKNGNVR